METVHTATQKVLHSYTKVRFQDADPFNHLNNSKYIDYMINAREDQVEEAYNLNFNTVAREQGLGWIVAQQQIAYFRPARTAEEVCIDSQLVTYSSRHIFVEIRMWDKMRQELKAFLWTHFMPISLQHQRLVDHPADLMVLFEAVQLPLEQTNFEARSQHWRQHNKANRKYPSA